MINIFKDKLVDYHIEQGDILPDLNRGYRYHAVKGVSKGGVSYEEGVFLYGLAIATKPDIIIETGTESGTSTLHLQLALKHQAHGEMISCEYKPQWANYTINRLIKNNVQLGHKMYQGDSRDFFKGFEPNPNLQYLIFIDTETHMRHEEFNIIKDKFPKGTVVAIHDTCANYPDNKVSLDKTGYNWTHIPSPRGIAITSLV